MRRGDWHRGPAIFSHPHAVAHGRPASAPSPPPNVRGRRWGGRRCVTPRQTCPQPDGVGRNLRSKTRWFTGFCNSHQVSHFATFFIDARAEISVAESRFVHSRLKSSAREWHPVSEANFDAHGLSISLGASHAGFWLSERAEHDLAGETPQQRGISSQAILTPKWRWMRAARAPIHTPSRCTGPTVALSSRFRQ